MNATPTRPTPKASATTNPKQANTNAPCASHSATNRHRRRLRVCSGWGGGGRQLLRLCRLRGGVSISTSAPTNLRPGQKEDVVFAAVSNAGDAVATGSKTPVTVTDALPAGLTAKAVKLVSSARSEEGVCEPLPALKCSFAKDVAPYVRLEMAVTVEVAEHAPARAAHEHRQAVTGAGTPEASSSEPLTVADEPTVFGVAGGRTFPGR